MNTKPRIIITISFSFSIRYIVRTGLLDLISEFAEPIVIITWNEQDLIHELKQKGIEVYLLPTTQRDITYVNHRRKIDYWFYHFALKSPTKKNQVRFLNQYKTLQAKLLSWSREKFNVLKMYLPGVIANLFKKETELLYTHTNYNEVKQWVLTLNAKAVFTVTPFHAQEDILLRVCSNLGMKMITAILSFDNITKRGWIPVAYDTYMVWNKYNLAELHRIYPYTKNKNVIITGAAQFDFYKNEKFLLNKNEWKKIVGINNADNQKIILYAGGPQQLFPNEPQYLKHIKEAIENGEIKGNPVVLFRCHPVDNIQRWKDAVGTSEHIIYDLSWSGKQNLMNANVTDLDIMKLCSTLAYTDVHINLCSTMTVDGSVFLKPQIGPAYDEVMPHKAHLLKGMYWQEHFIPIMQTNGLALANSKHQLITLINEALHHPQSMTNASSRIVNEIITYADGQCTKRVVQGIKNALS